jgi:hypothetical protein
MSEEEESMNKFTLADGRKSFYQWDVGRQLIVHDTACTEVHFFNGAGDCSLVCTVLDQDGLRVVNVPNILLQDTRSVTAFTFVEEANGGYTRQAVVFPVRYRPKPEDYVYTETEVLSYSYLDQRLKHLEGEGLAEAVAGYLKENPVQAGATEEEAKQIEQNRENISNLEKDKLNASELPTAINTALAQAKASGVFDGQPGKDGNDYVLTEADKTEIAKMAAELVEVPESGGDVDFQVDETLTLKDGVLSVNTTNDMEQDNTLPITSAGVFVTVGNIEALLKTI